MERHIVFVLIVVVADDDADVGAFGINGCVGPVN